MKEEKKIKIGKLNKGFSIPEQVLWDRNKIEGNNMKKTNKKPKKNNQTEIVGDKVNVGAIKNDEETWTIVRGLLKTLHKESDELGFRIKRSHYVIKKGNFSK